MILRKSVAEDTIIVPNYSITFAYGQLFMQNRNLELCFLGAEIRTVIDPYKDMLVPSRLHMVSEYSY